MTLSDTSILALLHRPDDPLVLDPYDHACLQPASYDIHLGGGIKYLADREADVIMDSTAPNAALWRESPHVIFDLQPHEFVLGVTAERIRVPADVVCRIEGRSTLGRSGLLPHLASGFCDPGFAGHLTLELLNASPYRQRLTVGMPIGQLSFDFLSTPAQRPYGHPDLGSRYQNQPSTPVSSRPSANTPLSVQRCASPPVCYAAATSVHTVPSTGTPVPLCEEHAAIWGRLFGAETIASL